MFSQKLRIILFCMTISFGLFPSAASAGFEVGNGGYGVFVKGQLYLQDLVEAGIYQNPVLSQRPGVQKYFQTAVSSALGGLGASDDFANSVVVKLEDIELIDPVFSHTLALALQAYSWRMVTVPLDDPGDSDGPIDEDPSQYRLLALRSGKMIRIQQTNWNLLNQKNQIALIFHEIIYALMKFDPSLSKSENSQRTRDLTSYLFSSDLQKRGLLGLGRAIGLSWHFGQGQSSWLQEESFSSQMVMQYSMSYQLPTSPPDELPLREVANFAWKIQESNADRNREVCQKLTPYKYHNIKSIEFLFQRTVSQYAFQEMSIGPSQSLQTRLVLNSQGQEATVASEYPVLSNCTARISKYIELGEKFMMSAH